jgi:hypothetical protein
MIDMAALRRLAEAGAVRVAVDVAGGIIETQETSGPGHAVLITTTPTDAVKVVNGGMIIESLNRDLLWSIEAFVLGSEVVMAIDGKVNSPEELVEAVSNAGFEWRVVSPSSSSP